jgi:hypothetical protein
MSWRDRVARHDPPDQVVAATPAQEAISTIATIGKRVFSTTTDRAGEKKVGSDDASSLDVVRDALAVSANSAVRAETPHFVSSLGDAVSAESANRTDDGREPWTGTEEERAAFVEHNGKIPREWAEGFARLHPDRSPSDMPPKRWQRFVDDVGLFLDSPFCAVAAALGWRPYDLFGCDRDRPYARIDQAGLLWLLNSNRLVALSENTATIESRIGTRQTYRRRPSEFGRVMAWELAR